jgi:hypothetical protein
MHSVLNLIAVCAIWTAVLGGSAVVDAAVHRPAWRRIGPSKYLSYVSATDFGPGKYLYPLFAIGGLPLLTVTLTIAHQHHAPRLTQWALSAGMALNILVLALTVTTVPKLLQAVRSSDVSAASQLLTRFQRRALLRSIALLMEFCSVISGLVLLVGVRI